MGLHRSHMIVEMGRSQTYSGGMGILLHLQLVMCPILKCDLGYPRLLIAAVESYHSHALVLENGRKMAEELYWWQLIRRL
jgi:hypothetical protein